MKFPLTVCVFLLTVIRSLSVDIIVRGTEGEPVRIKCPYPRGYENSYKYFYKGVHRDSVIILRSDGNKTSPRFSLRDDRQTRSFTVTISDLKMEDAGIYGCGAGWGEYKVIQLNVNKAPQKTAPVQIFTSTFYPDQTISSFSNTPPYLRTSDTNPQSSSITITDHQISSSTGSVVIIVTVEALVFLLIAVSLIIVAVRNKMKKKGLLLSIEEFNPEFYEKIKDAGRHCDPEDRDTITTVVYSCVS
ncbi:CMRF35-like molecule 3 [Megalobrama amblycephala]|uniref:CMRF35-like molecule 3 n=1 Tax=Megalobrama amblycephala TaxID=75352 RepID=UPI0020141E4E|nr:CMRF35-like molecule 3 [Megalobrama amblycephala]